MGINPRLKSYWIADWIPGGCGSHGCGSHSDHTSGLTVHPPAQNRRSGALLLSRHEPHSATQWRESQTEGVVLTLITRRPSHWTAEVPERAGYLVANGRSGPAPARGVHGASLVVEMVQTPSMPGLCPMFKTLPLGTARLPPSAHTIAHTASERDPVPAEPLCSEASASPSPWSPIMSEQMILSKLNSEASFSYPRPNDGSPSCVT